MLRVALPLIVKFETPIEIFPGKACDELGFQDASSE